MSIINLNLDFPKLRKEFQEKKYISIENFLAPEIAEDVYTGFKDISEKGLWYQSSYGSPKYYKKGLEMDESSVFHFSYKYEMFPLKNHPLDRMLESNITRTGIERVKHFAQNPEMELDNMHPLRKISYFLNSKEMHDLISFITSNILTYDKLLCFASRYTAHDFLSLHTDSPMNIEVPRKVAFVLNMTKHWLIHWGGNLVFLDNDEKKILDAYVPKFNNLILFNVPIKHAVLPVSVNCQSERFAVTGWYQRMTATSAKQ